MAGPKRYSRDHRDANEPELVSLAERLGAFWAPGPPLDGWLYHWSTGWVPIEFKAPEREGHASEFEPGQEKFMQECRGRGAPHLVLRTQADVLRAFSARSTA